LNIVIYLNKIRNIEDGESGKLEGKAQGIELPSLWAADLFGEWLVENKKYLK